MLMLLAVMMAMTIIMCFQHNSTKPIRFMMNITEYTLPPGGGPSIQVPLCLLA